MINKMFSGDVLYVLAFTGKIILYIIMIGAGKIVYQSFTSIAPKQKV